MMYALNEKTKAKELVGFSVDLIKGIADILKFQYEFYLSADGKYSGTNPDGSLAGVIGEVFSGVSKTTGSPSHASSFLF